MFLTKFKNGYNQHKEMNSARSSRKPGNKSPAASSSRRSPAPRSESSRSTRGEEQTVKPISSHVLANLNTEKK
jgi:hypothetical protein